jgi:hypothetical protein
MAALPPMPRQLPPWAGPSPQADTPYGPTLQPPSGPAEFPFTDARKSNPELFPPVCLRSHWDPEQIIRRTLPSAQIGTPLDPRPWTKVCMNYTTTQDFEDAPRPSDSVVFPSGGTVYPPTRYREAVDNESQLRRLDRPLGTCERDQYIPPRTGDLYRPNATVPDRGPISDRFIQELAFPMAAMRGDGAYECRAREEEAAWVRSPRPFNNATKQDRYVVSRPDLNRPQPVPRPTSQPTSPQSQVILS